MYFQISITIASILYSTQPYGNINRSDPVSEVIALLDYVYFIMDWCIYQFYTNIDSNLVLWNCIKHIIHHLWETPIILNYGKKNNCITTILLQHVRMKMAVLIIFYVIALFSAIWNCILTRAILRGLQTPGEAKAHSTLRGS